MAGSVVPPFKQLIQPGELELDSFGVYTALAGANYANVGGLPVLTNEINYLKTVATAGDAVALPAAVPGFSLEIYNDGAAEAAVFASGTDTVNDGSAGGYITQSPNFVYRFICALAGVWTCENVGNGFSGNFPITTAADGILAAGNSQGTATPLTHVMNRVTNADGTKGVLLPPSAGGSCITVANVSAASALKVYPAGTEKIEAAAASAAYSLAAATGGQSAKVAQFQCYAAGQWHLMLSSN